MKKKKGYKEVRLSIWDPLNVTANKKAPLLMVKDLNAIVLPVTISHANTVTHL